MNVRDRIAILEEIAAVAKLAGNTTLAQAALARRAELYTRPIPGFPGYLATLDGTIIGIYGRELKPWKKDYKRPQNYLKVGPVVDGKIVRAQVHALVALAFHGHPAEGEEIHHINHKHDDNRPENLRYMTRKAHVAEHHRHVLDNYF